MGTINSLANTFPQGEVHWITRQEYAPVLQLNEKIHKIWPYHKQSGLKGLLKLIITLKKEHFDYIYDAHSNLRSMIMKVLLYPFYQRLFFWRNHPRLIVRKKNRIKRFLLFKLGINLFPRPFCGIKSYLKALEKWGVGQELLPAAWKFSPKILQKVKEEVFSHLQQSIPTITIVPSAAWPMKRWPVEYWKKLILKLDQCQFIILGGPSDVFCREIASTASQRVLNLAGKLSLTESCAIIDQSRLFITGDTGLLHVGDLLQKTGIALMGPTAFGFPTNSSINIMEVPLKCRPCTKDGRGRCHQDIWQKCLVDIQPDMVAQKVQQLL